MLGESLLRILISKECLTCKLEGNPTCVLCNVLEMLEQRGETRGNDGISVAKSVSSESVKHLRRGIQ